MTRRAATVPAASTATTANAQPGTDDSLIGVVCPVAVVEFEDSAAELADSLADEETDDADDDGTDDDVADGDVCDEPAPTSVVW